MCAARRFLITLVRHGETELNRVGRVQGQGVDSHLNEKGEKQAHALGERLSNESFTLAYSSDLSRALETCKLLLLQNIPASNGTGVGINDIITDSNIRERCYGIMEGRTREEYEALAQSSGLTRADFVPQGAETILELGDRAESFFLDLSQRCFKSSGDVIPNVLVVSHGRLIVTLLARLSEKYGCPFPPGKLGVVPQNTAISCFEVSLTRHFIVCSNDGTGTLTPENAPKALNIKCTLLNSASHLI